MNTENLSTLKIHKLTQAQYDRALANGDIKENELYLTPDEEIDLTPYATVEQMNGKADAEHTHEINDVKNLQTTLDELSETLIKYTDDEIANLLNNSSTAVDSIMELAAAMEENEDVVNALNEAIGTKANTEHTHDDKYYTEQEIDDKLEYLYNEELNYVNGVASGIQVQLDDKATQEYVDIRVPTWTSADEGKSLRIVNGTPTWSAGIIASTTLIEEGSSSSYPESTLYVVYE